MTDAPPAAPARGSARDRLLAAAAEEFYATGVTGTGIDAVIAAAGVAKMSLYNNFASKAELVATYLDARHEEWLGLLDARMAAARTPAERALAVFDAYADHANAGYRDGFRGCGLLNAAAELPVGDPGRATVLAHKNRVEELLAEHVGAHLGESGGEAAAALAEHLALLLEGAMAKAGLEGSAARLERARALAARLLDDAAAARTAR